MLYAVVTTERPDSTLRDTHNAPNAVGSLTFLGFVRFITWPDTKLLPFSSTAPHPGRHALYLVLELLTHFLFNTINNNGLP